MVALLVARIRSPILFVLASLAVHWGVGRTLRANRTVEPPAAESVEMEIDTIALPDEPREDENRVEHAGRAESTGAKGESASKPAISPKAPSGDENGITILPSDSVASPVAPSPVNAGREEPGPTSPVGSAWSFNALAEKSSLAIESHPHVLTAAERSEKEAREATATFKSEMHKEMDKVGKEKGIRYSGPFLRAIETAMRSHDAPLEGTLRWTVTYGADGSVTISDEKHSNRWAKVEQSIRENLKRRGVRIPRGANGYQVVIESEASLRFPNGRRASELGASVEGPEVNAQIVEEKKTDESGATVKGDTVGSAQATLVKISLRGKVCTAHLRLGPKAGLRQTQEGISAFHFSLFDFGGGCDPTNIGTHAERVVRMRVIDEGRTE